MIKKYTYHLLYILCISALLGAQTSFAITNGMMASDLLGQYDQASFTSPAPVYTKGGANDGPNRFGFSSVQFSIFDTVNHRFFVSDYGNHRVLVYNLNADNTFIDKLPDYVLGQPNFYTGAAATTQTGMSGPEQLAYDATNQRLFVVDQNNRRVLVFDVTSITNGEAAINVLGQANFTSSAAATTQAGLASNVWGAVYDTTNQRLFVGDRDNNRVLVFDVTSITNGEAAINVLGQANFTSSALALTQIGMNAPQGLAYDEAGNRLFVAEAVNRRVTVYNVNPAVLIPNSSVTDGPNAIKVLGQANFTSSALALTQIGMNAPQGLAYDSAGSRLFVTDVGNQRVLVFDVASITDGEAAINVLGQTDFVSNVTAVTQGGLSGNPRSASYNTSTNQLFVAQENANRISIFDVASITNGENAVDLLGQYDETDFVNPVPAYTKSGVNNSPNRFGFNNPYDIALDTTSHRLFVTDYGNHRVLVYNLSSSNILVDRIPDYVLGQPNFYTNTSATTQTGMNTPLGLAYDGINSRLFVAEGNRVTVFDVASITNGEPAINVLGQSDFTSSSAATTQAGLSSPRGLAYDGINSRLFVGGSMDNRVTVFDVASITNGEPAINVLGQTDFTSSGGATSQSKFYSVEGLAYDSVSSRLFVAENHPNHRVTVFDVASITNGEPAINVLGQTDFTSSGSGITQSRLSSPRGLAYDSVNNRLFVTEGGRLTIFDVASITNGEPAINVLGQSDFTSNSNATTQSGMSTNGRVVYNPGNDQLFVADGGNHRLLIFSLSTTPTSISAPTGTYGQGSTIPISITFNNPVVVTGNPTLTLETGETNRTATYASGSGTSTLVFNYTVQLGDSNNDLDYTTTSALSLNGGTIIANNNDTASLTLPAPGAAGSLSATSDVVLSTATANTAGVGGSSGGRSSPILQSINTVDTTTALAPQTPTKDPESICPTLPATPKLLKLNTRHASVRTLQQILNCKGFTIAETGPGSPSKETTYFGPQTEKAVRAFQKAYKLRVDGVVGNGVRGVLLK